MFSAGKTVFLGAAVLLGGIAVACGGSAEGGDDDGGGASTVEVVDARFLPRELTVNVGDTVRWSFTGRLPHSIIGDFGAGEVTSERFTGAGSFEVTMTAAGRYEYACGVHTSRMLGTIVVE